MSLSKLRSRFQKSSDTPAAAATIDPVAQDAVKDAARDAVVQTGGAKDAAADAKPAEAVVATQAEPVVPAPEAAAPPLRGSKLVEGEKPRPSDPFATVRARAALAKAVAAAQPYRRHAKAAAAIAVTAGLGFAGGLLAAGGSEPRAPRIAVASLAPPVADTRSGSSELDRLSAEVKALRAGMEAAKAERERSRGDGLARQTQLVEKAERSSQDNASRIARIAEGLERLEKAQREMPRLAPVVERLDRLEKTMQVATAAPAVTATPPAPVAIPVAAASVAAIPTPPIKPDITQTGSLPDVKAAKAEATKSEATKAEAAKVEPAKVEADPRRTQLDGYIVRDVDDGYALIETKNGRFLEVAAGQMLAGIGRVEAVERRGRQWVVVTPRGFIGERWN